MSSIFCVRSITKIPSCSYFPRVRGVMKYVVDWPSINIHFPNHKIKSPVYIQAISHQLLWHKTSYCFVNVGGGRFSLRSFDRLVLPHLNFLFQRLDSFIWRTFITMYSWHFFIDACRYLPRRWNLCKPRFFILSVFCCVVLIQYNLKTKINLCITWILINCLLECQIS